MASTEGSFWARSPAELFAELGSGPQGLPDDDALRRERINAGKALSGTRDLSVPRLLLAQFTDPMVLLLGAAGVISFAVGNREDALIILLIVLLSGSLGFVQEYRAAQAVQRLMAMVAVTAEVLRGGAWSKIPVSRVVPGDVVRLGLGSTIPGDLRLLETQGLHVDESSLTGEPWPAEKGVESVAEDVAPIGRSCAAFLGSHVVSGGGTGLVVRVGKDTEFGQIGAGLAVQRDPTSFEKGLQSFGTMLVRVTAGLVLAVFAVHIASDRPVLDSFLFAVALAVGLVPELLPAIVTITLASGAHRMADRKVIVKRLAAIENFGSMDVLCSDKTGTLTEGKVRVHDAVDIAGSPSERVLKMVARNALLQASFDNPVDRAVRERVPEVDGVRVGELPYDFHRKRLSVGVDLPEGRILCTKGAVRELMEVCASVEMGGQTLPLAPHRAAIEAQVDHLAGQGLRSLGVAWRPLDPGTAIGAEAERDLIFLGFLVLTDPPKATAAQTVARFHAMGVRLKMVTGDNARVAAQVAREVGIHSAKVLTGAQVRSLSDRALAHRAKTVDVFAEVEPEQKERIIRALRRSGHCVGYLGDGINDAGALHAADVGISVDSAADVAKEAADIVLLEPNLEVLLEGVTEGRRTFANTLKYIQITTSANFGNMISMAGASVFLPFLPLLPKQILLNNLLSDLPSMTITGDNVDLEMVKRPRRWQMHELRSFMLIFGGISALFDFATFGALLWLPGASEATFQTGWFVESVLTELMVLLVIRTMRAAWRSRPSTPLLVSTAVVTVLSIALPWSPLAATFGLVPLPGLTVAALVTLTVAYVLASEAGKLWLRRRHGH